MLPCFRCVSLSFGVVNGSLLVIGRSVDGIELERCCTNVGHIVLNTGRNDNCVPISNGICFAPRIDSPLTCFKTEELINGMYFASELISWLYRHVYNLRMLRGVYHMTKVFICYYFVFDSKKVWSFHIHSVYRILIDMPPRVRKHLSQDPILKEVLARIPTLNPLVPKHGNDLFEALIDTVVGQQLSVKVADTLYARLKTRIVSVTPATIRTLAPEDIRALGIATSKAHTMLEIARLVETGELDLAALHTKSDQEVYETLLAIKGVGPWTSEMIMMFALGREDLFSPGDGGLMRAVSKLYGPERASKQALDELATTWKPYRTWAAKVLWSSLDNA